MITPQPRPKKKISRRKPGEKSFRNYFDDETQEAIIRYQESVIITAEGKIAFDYDARNKIYVEDIMPAFSALVENLINVYGYHVLYDSKDDLRNECLEFLYGTIDKWKKDRGTKAFSYFNVVAKHWLTIRSKQNVKFVQKYVSLDNTEALSKQDLHLIEEQNIMPSPEDILMHEDISKSLPQLIETLKEKAKTDNEQNCLNAIEILISNINDIDLLSKRAVMLYIREITGLTNKQLSIVLSSLKKQYRAVKEEMNK